MEGGGCRRDFQTRLEGGRARTKTLKRQASRWTFYCCCKEVQSGTSRESRDEDEACPGQRIGKRLGDGSVDEGGRNFGLGWVNKRKPEAQDSRVSSVVIWRETCMGTDGTEQGWPTRAEKNTGQEATLSTGDLGQGRAGQGQSHRN